METRNLFIHYGSKLAIRNASLKISERKVTSIIGPSGCGKSTLLRALNRMNDFIDGLRVEGQVLYRGQNVYERGVDPVLIRKKVGMVFQRPNPFPKSISKNITWGPKIHGMPGPYSEVVEESLRVTALWDEVKDRLNDSAMSLSGGQQQRLCIARAIAMKPDVILMDEPCSALDPRSTSRIEDLIGEMKKDYTIIIVTHNMQQAARISDETLFMCDGVLVESGPTSKIFTNPTHKETEDYITGRFG